jgi:site-specific DNA recombinase
MAERSVAFYARVSSDRQTQANTIASQIAALGDRIAADGWQLEPDHAYVDDGYSGSLLVRPALERLRDAVAGALPNSMFSLLTGWHAAMPIRPC